MVLGLEFGVAGDLLGIGEGLDDFESLAANGDVEGVIVGSANLQEVYLHGVGGHEGEVGVGAQQPSSCGLGNQNDLRGPTDRSKPAERYCDGAAVRGKRKKVERDGECDAVLDSRRRRCWRGRAGRERPVYCGRVNGIPS